MQTITLIHTVVRHSSALRFFAKCGAIVLLFVGGCIASLHAQDLPDVAQGLQPYASYHGGEMDNVSTVTGGLNLHIPLLSYPQKGSLALSYSLVFNSYSYQDAATCETSPDPSRGGIPIHSCTHHMQLTPMGTNRATPVVQVDQQLVPGVAGMPEPSISYEAPILARFYVVTSDGAEHPLGAASDGYRSTDESGYLFVPSTALSAMTVTTTPMGGTTGTITDPHGIVYTATGGTSNSITDPDGNAMTLFNSGAVTDSIARSIPSWTSTSASIANCPNLSAPFQPLASAYIWTPPGSGPGYLFCYATVNIHTHTAVGSSSGSSQYSGTIQVLQSIVLPNATYWGFVYDSNDPSSDPGPAGAGPTWTAGLGQLTKLIFPTGGWITYTYGLANGACDSARSASGINPSTIVTYIPQVTARKMYDKDGSVLGTWNYNIAGAGIATFGSTAYVPGTTITSPLGDEPRLG